MPLYEYECRKCKERFEVLQKIDEDKNNLRCPKCHTENPTRVLSLFSSSSSKSGNSGCSSSGST